MTDPIDNPHDFIRNISVTLISPDPFFLAGNQALMGRDRFSRVELTYNTTDEIDIKKHLERPASEIHAIVIDFGYTGPYQHALKTIDALRGHFKDNIRIIAFVDEDNNREHIQAMIDNEHLDAVLYKHEIGPTTHLIIQAAFRLTPNDCMLTPSLWNQFIDGVVPEDQYYPIDMSQPWDKDLDARNLRPSEAKVFILRVLAGLDPPDIRNELRIKTPTLSTHLQNITEAFEIAQQENDKQLRGAKLTLALFEELSRWWWEENIEWQLNL